MCLFSNVTCEDGRTMPESNVQEEVRKEQGVLHFQQAQGLPQAVLADVGAGDRELGALQDQV